MSDEPSAANTPVSIGQRLATIVNFGTDKFSLDRVKSWKYVRIAGLVNPKTLWLQVNMLNQLKLRIKASQLSCALLNTVLNVRRVPGP